MKRILLNNLLMKVFALALALVVWSAIRMQISKGAPLWSSRSVTSAAFTQIPINVMKVPSDSNVYELIPESASISVSGSRVNVSSVKPELITLFVAVTPEEVANAPLTEDTNKVVLIRRVQAKIPPELTLGTIEPSTVRLITTVPTPPTNHTVPSGVAHALPTSSADSTQEQDSSQVSTASTPSQPADHLHQEATTTP